MKKAILVTSCIIVCFVLSISANAQSFAYSISSVTYDPDTDIVTGVSMTDPDFYADEFYDARIISKLTDSDGNLLAQAFVTDESGTGVVSSTLSYPGAVYNNGEFKLRTFHGLRMVLRDFASNQYIDYWDFGYNTPFNIEAEPSYDFPGLGPQILRAVSSINLGYTTQRLTVGVSVSVLTKAAMSNHYTKIAFCNVHCPTDAYLASTNMGQYIAAGVPWVYINGYQCSNVNAVHSTSSATQCADYSGTVKIWW